ncbi:MAG: alpha/beta hydrolase [Rhodothermia bacterium]|nr:MAG: alpha/beta hydrolase [Rhodothermia bacterium]
MQQRNSDLQHPNTLEIKVDSHRVRLSFESSGEKGSPAVLLLHGWGSSARLMRPIAKWLEATHYVVNIDFPGHGNSPVPPTAWEMDDYASAVRQVADQLFDGPFSIVGHSNGGRIALFVSSDAFTPDSLEKLVLFSPSGVRRKRSIRTYIRVIVASVLRSPFQILPERIREFGLDWLRHTLVWKLLSSSDYRTLDGVMRETFVKTVNSYLEDRLPDVLQPVLLFRGENDDSITKTQIKLMEKEIPDAGLVTVENAGHFPFLDQPDTVRTTLLHFLNDQ